MPEPSGWPEQVSFMLTATTYETALAELDDDLPEPTVVGTGPNARYRFDVSRADAVRIRGLVIDALREQILGVAPNRALISAMRLDAAKLDLALT